MKSQGRWKKAKAAHKAKEQEFTKLKAQCVDELLLDEEQRSSVASRVESEIAALRLGSDWHSAIDYTAAKLVPYLRKEASKSPRHRAFPQAATLRHRRSRHCCLLALRLMSGTPVTEPPETRVGLTQRASFPYRAFALHADRRAGLSAVLELRCCGIKLLAIISDTGDERGCLLATDAMFPRKIADFISFV